MENRLWAVICLVLTSCTLFANEERDSLKISHLGARTSKNTEISSQRQQAVVGSYSGIVKQAAPYHFRGSHHINIGPEQRKAIASDSSALAVYELGKGQDDFNRVLTTGTVRYDSIADENLAVFDQLEQGQRFIDKLTGKDLIRLPVGLSKYFGSAQATMAISQVSFTPRHATLTVVLKIDIPESERPLIFGASGVNFSRTGGIEGEARLHLLADYFLDTGNDNTLLLIRGASQENPSAGSYVTIDCDGLKSLSLDAEYVVSRNLLIPVDGQGEDQSGRVSTSFQLTLTNWNELYISLDLPSFRIQNVKDLFFKVRGATLDLSDIQSPPGAVFPPSYPSPFASGTGTLPIWRGLHIEQFSIGISKRLRQQGKPLEVNGQNILIDELGLTADVEVKNLLSLKEGNAAGWAFSIDQLVLKIMADQFKTFGFQGLIHVPIFRQKGAGKMTPIAVEDCFQYTGIIKPDGEFYLSVAVSDEMEADLWQAKVLLDDNSLIDLSSDNAGFSAHATLHGRINVGSEKESGRSIEYEGLRFQNVGLSSRAPYFEPGTWDIAGASTGRFAGFIIGLEDINIQRGHTDREVLLSMSTQLNLASESLGLTAATQLRIFGQLEQQNSRQRWQFDRVELDDIYVDADAQAFHVKGYLSFFEKQDLWGEGFYGLLDAEFKGIGAEVAAMAQFGNLSDYRYFMVDGFVKFDKGIPIVPGLELRGFGGGAYRNMRRETLPRMNFANAPSPTNPSLPVVGESLSGNRYRPSPGIGLGIKAAALLSTVNEEAFNAFAAIDFGFNDTGLDYIRFDGKANIMGPMSWSTELSPESKISAGLKADFNFAKGEFFGAADVYANASFVHGGQGGNKAGHMEMLFGNREWYVNVGRPEPSQRINLVFADFARLDAYLNIGTNIPPMPGLPANVRELLQTNTFGRNSSQYASGRGFAFGASFEMDTGDQDFLIFYGRFRVGAGFDVMLQQYANAYCANHSGPIGINGWYASGQVWAYLGGKVGIRARIFGKEREFDILELAAAAALRGKLPNPVFIEGYVGGDYSVLGGLVKGTCRFKVTLGEPCEVQGQDVADAKFDVISYLDPMEGETDVAVDRNLEAGFIFPIGRQFSLPDDAGNSEMFRLHLEQMRLINYTSQGQLIRGMISYKLDKTVAVFIPHAMLPGEAELGFQVKVKIQEYRDGVWKDLLVDGVPYIAQREVRFNTAPSPPQLSLANIKASYPVDRQLNFLKSESRQGFILLYKWQKELLEDQYRQSELAMQFINASGQVFASMPVSYDIAQRRILYPIPDQLQNESIYQAQLVAAAAERTISPPSSPILPGSPRPGPKMRGGPIEPDLSIGHNRSRPTNTAPPSEQPAVLYTIHFRTSRYNSLQEKWNELVFSPVRVGMGLNGPEQFDQFDLEGGKDFESLIHIELIPEQNRWFKHALQKDFYSIYPGPHMEITREDAYGLPPLEAFRLSQSNSHVMLSDSMLQFGNRQSSSFTGYLHNLFHPLVLKDYNTAEYQARNYITSNLDVIAESNPDFYRYFPKAVVDIFTGKIKLHPASWRPYVLRIQYRLPGQGSATSSFQSSFSF